MWSGEGLVLTLDRKFGMWDVQMAFCLNMHYSNVEPRMGTGCSREMRYRVDMGCSDEVLTGWLYIIAISTANIQLIPYLYSQHNHSREGWG